MKPAFSWWQEYLSGGANIEGRTETDRSRAKFINGFSAIGIASLLLFSGAYLYKGRISFALFELCGAMLALGNIFLLRRSGNVARSSAIMLTIMIGILTVLFFDGGLYGTGLYWFFTFPLLALFLRGSKNGSAWILALLAIEGNLWLLSQFGVFSIPFTSNYLATSLTSFLAVTGLVYIFQSVNEIDGVTIYEQQRKLLGSNDELSRQITIRRDAEEELARTIRQLNAQNSKLEKSQQAMLNILEDLEAARAKVEESYAKDQAMLASIGDGLFATDTTGKIILVNGAFEQMLGWTKEEIVGEVFTEKVSMTDEHGRSVPLKDRVLNQVLKTHKAGALSTPLYYRRKNGTTFPATITVSPIMIGNEFIGTVEVFHDVTKEKEVDRAKTEFVSLASHQLRTPLSAINWFAEMLLDGDAGKITNDQRHYIRQIRESNQRMVELINSLLNVSRIELGTFAVEPEPTDILRLAKSVISEEEAQIRAHNLRIVEKYDKLPKLSVDPKLFRIILQNLISNAIKYTPGRGTVTVSITREQGGKEKEENVLIMVKDTGYGIPKNQQGKIFTKLFRADNVLLKETEGTGLGLYIVKSIVEQSGGAIWFESEENKGTTFYVTLPFKGMKAKAGGKKLS